MSQRILNYCDLDFIDYQEAWDLQKDILNLRVDEKVNDVLFLLEHPHTYTLGKVADKKNLISSENYLHENKISVFDIDRGGDITYHGPGQIVGYPILDLENFFTDIHKYLRYLEETVILTCRNYGIDAGRINGLTGVWLDYEKQIRPRKICAIGVRSSHWVTMHGFAFNIETDLTYFNNIIPCGISDKAVTSLSTELGRKVDVREVQSLLKENFVTLFEGSSIEEFDEKGHYQV